MGTHLSVLNGKGVLETRLEHLKEFRVVSIVTDVVENVLVGDDVERTEDDNDGNVVTDVGKGSLDRRSTLQNRVGSVNFEVRGREETHLTLVTSHHLDLHRADRLASLLYGTTDLGEEGDGRGLRLCEDVDAVGGHPLLRNEYLLTSIDDKVSSLCVEWSELEYSGGGRRRLTLS